MRRNLFTLATGMSAVLCAGVCVLWVRSYGAYDWYIFDRPMWSVFVVVSEGEFRLEHTRIVDPEWVGPHHPGFEHRTGQPSGRGVFPERLPGERRYDLGRNFTLVTGERWGSDHYALFLPGWAMILVTGLLPIARCTTLLRRNGRREPDLCPGCGYDLRATPDRCPECGAVPAAKPERA